MGGARVQHNDDITAKGKIIPVLRKVPRHEDVFREWRYSATHS